MENIREIEVETASGIETHIIMNRGNDEFTSMPKVFWDELKAKRESGEII